MNGQIISGIARLLLGLLLTMPLYLYAGERIEIGTQKSKFAPPQDTKLSRELNKQWGTKLDGDPLNELSVPASYKNEVWDPRKEKVRKLKEIEERNWMMMDAGDLSEKEEGKFGAKDENDDPLKEDASKDWMFGGIGKEPNSKDEPSQARPGQKNPGNRNNAQKAPPPPREDDELSKSIRASSSSSSVKNDTQAGGAHTSRELDFRTLFNPAASKDGAGDKGDPDMSENVFKHGGLGMLSKEKQAMRDEYRNFLNGSSSSSDTAGILSEPKGFTTSPLLRKPGELGTKPGGLEMFGPSRINDAPLRQDWNVGRVSGFGTLPSPALTPPMSEPPLQPRQNFDASKARGLNSLGGH